MKKFSKESMQNFMLMHAEKLILGGCLAATGLLVWMSMGGENEVKETPSELKNKANLAQQYIDREAWEGDDKLQAFRKGRADAKEKIENAKRVDPDNFSLAILGTPAAALAKRLDPEIVRPEQLIANRFSVGVLMDLPDFRSPLSNLSPAPVSADSTGGFSGFQGGGGEDYGDDYGGGGDYGAGQSSTGSTGLSADYPVLPRSGTFNEANAFTAKGLRPSAIGISADKITTSILDVVCVTAVVDYQKQTAAFEKAFAESVAFNAKRDRPVYQFLQVERREIANAETPWQDISEDVIYTYPRRCPSSLVKMPRQIYRSAPEVIAPENYDPILSGVIPAFVMLDYQQIASHPALKQQREFPAWIPPKGKKMMDGDPDFDMFEPDSEPFDNMNEYGSGGPGEDSMNSLRRGSATEAYKEAIAMRKPGGQYRLVRFFDLVAPKNKSFEYRTRVWVGDPNQLDPVDGFRKNRGKRLEASPEGGVKFAGTSDSGMDSGMDEMDTYGQDDDGMDIDGPKRTEVVQEIKKTMLLPSVRKRQAAASNLDTMQQQLEDAARSDKPMEPFYVSEFSEAGELEKINLPVSPRRYAFMQYLRFARPSAWSEPVRVEKERPSADVYAGPTVRSRPIQMDAGAGAVEFDPVEPTIKVVVSSWTRDLGAKLPSNRSVHIGETLDFNAPAYVTHPISWTVLAAENPRNQNEDDPKKYILPFRTGTMVVDAFFGKKMELPNNKKLEMEMPTEVLTMDVNGNLKVSNQFDAETDYRNEITKKDSARFYGRARRSKKPEKDEYEEYGDEYN